MTKRSRLYFQRTQRNKYAGSALAILSPIFEAYGLTMEAMKKLSQPMAKRIFPAFSHPGGPAIVDTYTPPFIKEAEYNIVIEHAFTPSAIGKIEKVFPQNAICPPAEDNKIPTKR